jgi:hypothetical protein
VAWTFFVVLYFSWQGSSTLIVLVVAGTIFAVSYFSWLELLVSFCAFRGWEYWHALIPFVAGSIRVVSSLSWLGLFLPFRTCRGWAHFVFNISRG